MSNTAKGEDGAAHRQRRNLDRQEAVTFPDLHAIGLVGWRQTLDRIRDSAPHQLKPVINAHGLGFSAQTMLM